jgi:hypothetical protein
MKRGLIVSVLICITLISLASAYTTPIKIKSLPVHNIQISVCDLNGGSFKSYNNLQGRTDGYGDFNISFASNVSQFNLIVFIKQGQETVLKETYIEKFKAGNPIELEIGPDGYEFIQTPAPQEPEPEINTTEENNQTTELIPEAATEDSQSPLSGFVTSTKNFATNKTTLYTIGGVILLIIILIVIIKSSKKKKENKEPEKKTDSKDKKEDKPKEEDDLTQAEEDFRKAKKKLLAIKNKDKIAELKKKLIEDEKELMKLRRGE